MNPKSFTCKYFERADNFLAYAKSFLAEREDLYGLILGLAQEKRTRNEPVRAWVVSRQEKIHFLIFQTPPLNLILSEAPDLSSVSFAVNHLIQNHRDLDFLGIVGPVHESQVFAANWSDLSSDQFKIGFRQRLHRIETVYFPSGVEGKMTLAGDEDLDLVTSWSDQFILEAIPNERPSRETLQNQVKIRLANKSIYLWRVNGEAVALAGASRATQNGISINLVYTPKHFRSHGYASALVAAATQIQLESGRKFCILYTDLANPTSNLIYRKIGYRPVSDSIHLTRLINSKD